MKAREKLLILSPRFPYPLEKGDKLRLYYQIKFLSKSFDIYLISLSDEATKAEDQSHLKSLCKEVIVLRQKSFLNVRAGIKAFVNREPLQTSYYFDKQLSNKIDVLVARIAPDAIFVQLIRMADFALKFEQPKVIDYMDAMSLNMTRESKIRKFPFSHIYRREAQLLLNKERLVASSFDNRIIISNRDKLYLEKSGVLPLVVQGNGVKHDYFHRDKVALKVKKYDLVFVGNMGYLPNVEAAEYLVNQIAKKYTPTLKVAIAGARPHKRVLKLASENVTITGWVEDIRAEYISAKIMVAPIFTGAGQQNKILEAMSLSMPCITTSQVNASINAEIDKEILIADSPQEFQNQIKYLLNSESRRREIGQNARIFVEQNFDWHDQVEILKNVILELIKK